MYPKFKEIALDTATWTVAFLGAIEERETKSKKPFCTFHLLDGDIAIQYILMEKSIGDYVCWIFAQVKMLRRRQVSKKNSLRC